MWFGLLAATICGCLYLMGYAHGRMDAACNNMIASLDRLEKKLRQ